MKERWLPVRRYEGRYEVSALGRVRRINRGLNRGALVLKQRGVNGYKVVALRGLNHAALRSRLVHLLVAEAFLGPKPDGRQVNHKDCNKGNNASFNLEYVTPCENMHHARLNGRLALGSRNGSARLSDAAIRTICKERRDGRTHQELAERFHVARSTISRVLSGESWSHIGAHLPSAGRLTARGVRNGSSRLTDAQVVEIRSRAMMGENLTALARAYRVGRTTVRHIVRMDTWRHVEGSR